MTDGSEDDNKGDESDLERNGNPGPEITSKEQAVQLLYVVCTLAE